MQLIDTISRIIWIPIKPCHLVTPDYASLNDRLSFWPVWPCHVSIQGQFVLYVEGTREYSEAVISPSGQSREGAGSAGGGFMLTALIRTPGTLPCVLGIWGRLGGGSEKHEMQGAIWTDTWQLFCFVKSRGIWIAWYVFTCKCLRFVIFPFSTYFKLIALYNLYFPLSLQRNEQIAVSQE